MLLALKNNKTNLHALDISNFSPIAQTSSSANNLARVVPTLIRWIAISPADTVIQPSNNRGLTRNLLIHGKGLNFKTRHFQIEHGG